MAANAITSANGRMRKVFILDTKQYRLEAGETPEQNYSPVLKKYEGLAAGLNSLHPEFPVEVCLFFRINPHGPQAKMWLDPVRHIRFIPVNAGNTTTSVSTSWVQDKINIINKGELLLDPTCFDESMKALLKEYSGASNISWFATPCDGGNLLRGHHKSVVEFNYIIKSWHTEGSIEEKELSQRTGVKRRNIFNVGKSEDRVAHKVALFHSDMYCTIVGNTDNRQELILVGQPFEEEKWTTLNTAFGGLKERLEELSKNMPVQFKTEQLSMIVLNNKQDQMTHIFSYNNCLVENYRDEQGKRNINFYFPNFLYELENTAIQNKAKKDALAALDPAESALPAVAMLAAKPHDPKKLGVIVPNAQQQLEQKLLDYFKNYFPDIRCRIAFVNHDFKTLSQKHGGLHCMVKVIERDLL